MWGGGWGQGWNWGHSAEAAHGGAAAPAATADSAAAPASPATATSAAVPSPSPGDALDVAADTQLTEAMLDDSLIPGDGAGALALAHGSVDRALSSVEKSHLTAQQLRQLPTAG